MKSELVQVERLRCFEWARDFSDDELRLLLPAMHGEAYAPGEVLAREGEHTMELLLIERGSVSISKGIGGDTEAPYVLTEIVAPATLGELAFLDRAPRTATIRALDAVHLVRLDRPEFDALAIPPALCDKLTARLGLNVIRHIRLADSRLIEQVESRRRFGHFVVIALLLVMGQNYLTAYLHKISSVLPAYVISVVALAAATIACVMMMHLVRRPLQFFGLTTAGWLPAAREGLLIAFVLLGAFQFLFPGRLAVVFSEFVLTWTGCAYFVSAFLQEFTFRGVYQTALQEFYEDAKGTWAVPLTAMAFAGAHVIHNARLTLATFVISFVLGWLYIRHRNLVGVTLLHFVMGIMAVALGILDA
ncbi:CPBP family glutamic-type intramembrane protease [Acanthopleuribacter pedis]|uniref:Cyclic nucleotide-binding domain-containing protein n=1 Tax=Acanthopleuribacter pedis TaxID=442870 RepID=A0A8J7QD81_9BACT|nr:CPBP family glutamic-type intramembrane protease [Acanthopleuribacter pedis]MBO1317450.1 cyclic nucleotide-binding domain-containing protein [Acanthopleuribacter pedis]